MKESIEIKIEAHVFSKENNLHDYRTVKVEGTRGEVAKKLDEICADIESCFDH